MIRISNASLPGSEFDDADLSEARFSDVSLKEAVFSNVDLGRCLVTDANAEQMVIRNVAMNAAVMENVVLHAASLTHVDLNGSTIRFASLATPQSPNATSRPDNQWLSGDGSAATGGRSASRARLTARRAPALRCGITMSMNSNRKARCFQRGPFDPVDRIVDTRDRATMPAPVRSRLRAILNIPAASAAVRHRS